MPRLARIVVPDLPHHVTQRGNRRTQIFFERDDEEIYRTLLASQARKERLAIWAYCLMPNHVHLIAVPGDPRGLSRAIGETHRLYTNIINARYGWIGHLFQSRFASVVMDDDHLMAAVRYVSLNPVRARLVQKADDWPWSSVRAHLSGRDDKLVTVAPVLARVPNFAAFLHPQEADEESFAALRRAEASGRPLGTKEFVATHRDRLPSPKEGTG
jgi:putative transposase